MAEAAHRDKIVDQIAELRESGKSYAWIGRKLGMSNGNVNWICLKYGFEKANRRDPLGARGPLRMMRGNHVVRRYTPDEDAKIIEMTLAGDNTTAIARALGRKPQSILARKMTLARIEERALEKSEWPTAS